MLNRMWPVHSCPAPTPRGAEAEPNRAEGGASEAANNAIADTQVVVDSEGASPMLWRSFPQPNIL